MSPEATAAKRKQIAASIRDAAAKQQGKEQLLHFMESLTYDAAPATITKVTELATAWQASFKDLSPDKLADKKGEVLQVNKALQYLVRFKMLPDSFPLNAPLKKLIKDLAWDE
jgi:predicted RNA-binding protein Jag